VSDLQQANYEFKKFRQKLERFLGKKVVYFCVPEFQKRGAVHYHLLLDMPFVSWEKLSSLWGHGRIQIEQIRDKRKAGSYLSHYINKDKSDIRYYRQKAFFIQGML